MTFRESLMLISGIGMVVGTGVLGFAIANDWRLAQMKDAWTYVKIAGFVIPPFALVLALCILFPRHRSK